MLLRVVGSPTYDAYAKNLAYIRDRWTKRVTRAPALSAAREAQVEGGLGLESATTTEEPAIAMRAPR